MDVKTDIAASASSSYDNDDPAWQIVANSILDIFPDSAIVPSLLIGQTDGKHYEWLCNKIYRFTPNNIHISESPMWHGVNERISVEGYADIVRFYHRLIANAAYNIKAKTEGSRVTKANPGEARVEKSINLNAYLGNVLDPINLNVDAKKENASVSDGDGEEAVYVSALEDGGVKEEAGKVDKVPEDIVAADAVPEAVKETEVGVEANAAAAAASESVDDEYEVAAASVAIDDEVSEVSELPKDVSEAEVIEDAAAKEVDEIAAEVTPPEIATDAAEQEVAEAAAEAEVATETAGPAEAAG
jgi:hypothetical protein